MGETATFTISRLKRALGVAFLLSILCLTLLWSPRLQISRHWSKLVGGWPTNHKLPYTAAIVYLVRLSDASDLLESLASVNANLALAQPWPIVLFHTGDFDAESSRKDFTIQLHNRIGVENGSLDFASKIEFVKLDWRLPEGIPADKEVLDPIDAYRWPGYHHMCKFYAVDIFSTPRLKDVTYYMRLDSDSLILEPLCYDPFEVMYIRHRAYGYFGVGMDAVEATQGMWPFVHKYAVTHPAVEKQLDGNKWEWPQERNAEGDMIGQFKGYDTNFEIVKLEEFRRPNVKHWLDELVRYPEAFFKWRWGDAPIRWATVQMFFDAENDTEQFCGMRYFHPFTAQDNCECAPLPSTAASGGP